jgi:hypothetical protein
MQGFILADADQSTSASKQEFRGWFTKCHSIISIFGVAAGHPANLLA